MSIKRFANKRVEQYRNRIIPGMAIDYAARDVREKNKGTNQVPRFGPRIKFERYYSNYIESTLNGNMPTMLQSIEIVKNFLNKEGNEKIKSIYSVEDVINWLPKKAREEDENER